MTALDLSHPGSMILAETIVLSPAGWVVRYISRRSGGVQCLPPLRSERN